MSNNRPIVNLDDITADILAGSDTGLGGAASLPVFREEAPVEEAPEVKPFIRIEFDITDEGAFQAFRLESMGVGNTQEAFIGTLEMVLNSIKGNEGERVAPSELNS